MSINNNLKSPVKCYQQGAVWDSVNKCQNKAIFYNKLCDKSCHNTKPENTEFIPREETLETDTRSVQPTEQGTIVNY